MLTHLNNVCRKVLIFFFIFSIYLLIFNTVLFAKSTILERCSPYPIVLGGTSGFNKLADPAASVQLRASGRVSYYLHFSATDKGLFGSALGNISSIFSHECGGVAEVSLGGGFNNSFWDSAAWRDNILGRGFHPQATVINVDLAPKAFSSKFSASRLTMFSDFVDSGRARGGILIFAPVVSPNSSGGIGVVGDSQTLSVLHPWNDDWWDNVRLAARYGGGLSIDCPSAFFFHGLPDGIQQEAYQRFTIDVLTWAREENLLAFFLVSPYFDLEKFADNSKNLYRFIKEHDALPTTWALVNYNECGDPYSRQCVKGKDPAFGNPVGLESDENGEAALALWFSRNAAVRQIR